MKEIILQILQQQPGEFVSGEEICHQLQMTRAGVWKHIRVLREEGYEIEAYTRRGYRLVTCPDRLYPALIKAKLNTRLVGAHIHYFDETESTNKEAKTLAQQGAPAGTTVLAEAQTGGKGRLGRPWFSPHGSGIWCSVIFRPAIQPVMAARFTLMGPVAAVRAIRRVTGVEVGIKWPNDLSLAERKLGGILNEMQAEMDRINYLVVGIGINVRSPQNWPEEIREKAVALESLAPGVSRVDLAAALLQELEELYFLTLEDFAAVRDEWTKLNILLGRNVVVNTIQGNFTGVATGVDAEGGLILLTTDGHRQVITAGDVALI